VADRRKQKEELRREREERERQAQDAKARKRLVGYGAAAALVLAAGAVLAILVLGGGGSESEANADLLPGGGDVPEQAEFDLRKAASAAGCRLKAVRASGTADHTQDPNEHVKYDSNPPTSGRHFVVPVDDGAYTDAPSDEQLVHNLEHGRVIIWFKPSLPAADRASLKALYEEDSYQMLLVPRSNMSYRVAASAWNGDPAPSGVGRLLTCANVGPPLYDALRAFRDENRSQGPEAVP
jgi:hypothetical protein